MTTTLRDLIDYGDKTLVRWNGKPALWLEREPLGGRWMLADEGGTSVPADLDDDAHDVAREWLEATDLSDDVLALLRVARALPVIGESCRECAADALAPATLEHAAGCSRS